MNFHLEIVKSCSVRQTEQSRCKGLLFFKRKKPSIPYLQEAPDSEIVNIRIKRPSVVAMLINF